MHALRRRALSEVLECLEGLDVIVGPDVAHYPWRLSVRAEDRDAMTAALEDLDGSWARGSVPGGSGVRLRHHVAIGRERVAAGTALDVHLDVMSREGDAYLSRTLGAFSRVPAARWETLAARSRPRRAVEAVAPEPGVPIDVVYTWVDGADPAWRRRREAALTEVTSGTAPPPHPTAVDAARFASGEELRHSLRSLHQFAGWVRTIHLVTDQQIPSWLDAEHPQVHVVDHETLLGASRFNSHAIEAALHRIPGLAEHYLYLNDDVFFGRVAHPSDFFASVYVARFFPSDLPIDPGPATAEDLPLMAAAKNGRDLIARRFGQTVGTRIRHTVHPQLRSVCEQIEEENPEAVERTRSAAFRSPTDISMAASLHHWYAHALGKSAASPLSYRYVDIDAPGAPQVLDAIQSRRQYDTFCLNQESTAAGSAAAQREMTRFLARYFPHPAPWERRGSALSTADGQGHDEA